MKQQRAFSLVELLVVLTIMAVLASIAMPLAEVSHRRTQEEELRRSLREIRNAIDAFKHLVDVGRISRPAGSSGYPPSLTSLVDGVADAQSPQGAKIYLLRRLPRDPFAPRDIVDSSETWGLRSYASTPQEPQPGDDVFDVYSKAQGAGLNGVPYRRW
jgi:general secretion pathway protein G